MFAESVHRSATRVRMHSPTGAECNARHAIGGEMHGVGAWPPDNRGRTLTSHVSLCRAKRLNDRKTAVQHSRGIAYIDVQGRFRCSGALREAAQHSPQVTLDGVDGLAWDRADIKVETAGIRIARQAPWRASADRGDR